MKIIEDGTAEIIMHPVRFKILQFIKQSSEPPFVEQISKAVKVHPRLVSHHLNVLQEAGLINCKYEVVMAKGSTTRGVAVRTCSPTPYLTKAFGLIGTAMSEVK